MVLAMRLHESEIARYSSLAEEFFKQGLVEYSFNGYVLKFEKQKRYCSLLESTDQGKTFELRSSSRLHWRRREAIFTLLWTFAMSEAELLSR